MRGTHFTAIGTLHNYFVATALNALGTGTFQQFNALIEKRFLQNCSRFGVFTRQNLLTAHNKRHLCTEGSKHVHEFHNCYTRANHSNAFRKDFWWIALTGNKNALAVGRAPLRNARARTGGNNECIAFNALFACGSTHDHRMRVNKTRFTANNANALAVEQLSGGIF